MKERYERKKGFLIGDVFYDESIKSKAPVERITSTKKAIDEFYGNVTSAYINLMFQKLKYAEKHMKFTELSFENISLPYISACISGVLSLIISFTINIGEKIPDVENFWQFIGVFLGYVIIVMIIVLPISFVIGFILLKEIKHNRKDYFVYIRPYEIKVIRNTLDKLMSDTNIGTSLFNENTSNQCTNSSENKHFDRYVKTFGELIMKPFENFINSKNPQIADKAVDTTERTSTIYLDIVRETYNNEIERTNMLDKKASVFITAIIAVITIFIPIIPFEQIIEVYQYGNKLQIIVATCSLCALLVSFVLLGIAFFYLYKAFSLRSFGKVNLENISKTINQKHSIIEIEKNLFSHYKTICVENTNINNEKAKKIKFGLKLSMFSFLILCIAAISLIIVVGVEING